MSKGGIICLRVPQTKGEVNKAWREEYITDNGHTECRIYGHEESQLNNCTEISSGWVKGNSDRG